MAAQPMKGSAAADDDAMKTDAGIKKNVTI
jgi:hypothetical protein